MKIFIRLLILLALLIPNLSLSMEIELSDVRGIMKFVKPDGKMYGGTLSQFTQPTDINGNVELWSTFKSKLTTRAKKGIAGEVATKIFFENLGYKILEDHYNQRIALLKGKKANVKMKNDATCTTKKGPDNGIDGIFILKSENFENPSHIVINEAKFRDKLSLSAKTDFGFVTGAIQQSHSNWNEPRFSWPTCLSNLDYAQQVIVRTATLLDKEGTLKLYEVRDKGKPNTIVGEYASEAQLGWNIRKYYDQNIKTKFN